MKKYFNSSGTDGFYHSVDVLGCIDYAEAGALNTVQQDVLKFIISAGYVDLNVESTTMGIFDSFFPSGNTHNAIQTMIASSIKV